MSEAMTGQQFREARVTAGLSVRKAAEALGVAPSTIQRWQLEGVNNADAIARIRALAGDAPLLPLVATALGRLYAVLERVITADGGQTPGDAALLLLNDPAVGVALLLRQAQAGHAGALHEAENTITAIMADIPGFPERLNDEAQGHFWLGYYAQKQVL